MIKCDVIQDLLPLYSDNVASEGSRAMVDEHIGGCGNCREILAKMKDGGTSVHLPVDKAEISAFKIIKQKLRRKNLLIACISVAATIALIYGVFGYHTHTAYNADKISAKLAYDQIVDIFYDGNYKGAHAIQKGDEVYVGYESTLWTRLFYNGEKKQFSIGQTIMVDFGGNGEMTELLINTTGDTIEIDTDFGKSTISPTINKVYYLDYRTYNLEGAEWENAKKDAVLIWER